MFNSVINNNMESNTTQNQEYTTPKHLPNSMQKESVYVVFYPISRRTIRASLKIIIPANRKEHHECIGKTPEQINATKYVYKRELIELFKIYDTPNYFLVEKI